MTVTLPGSILSRWMIVFTGWYWGKGTELLSGMADDIADIDGKLRAANQNSPDSLWSDESLRHDPFWNEIQLLAKGALKRRDLEIAKPNQAEWYFILPEDLH